MEPVAIYARVSTSGQEEKQTIEYQLVACRDLAQQRDYKVVEEFCDEDVSGTIPFADRTAGSELLARTDEFDKVIVYCVDRLGRDLVEGVIAYRALRKAGTPVEFVSQSFDDTPEGSFTFNLFLAVAELERAVITRRTSGGRERRVNSGRYQASIPPYGYIYDQEAGTLSPDPTSSNFVRQIFKWAVCGKGLKDIANRLNDEEVPPPSVKSRWGWHHTTIWKILTHPRYIGKATYGRNKLPMTCPPLVDEDTFYDVQTALKQRRIRASRNTRYVYLLQHLLYCRHCGSRYSSEMASRKDGDVVIYRCAKRKVYGAKADHDGIKWRWEGRKLEEPVKSLIRRFMSDPMLVAKHLEVYVEHLEGQAGEQDERIDQLRKQLSGLEEEEARILNLAQKGVYSDEDQMLAKLEGVRSKQRDVKAKIKAITAETRPQIRRVEALDSITNLWRQMKELMELLVEGEKKFGVEFNIKWSEYTVAQWREVIRYFVDKIWVEDDGTLSLESYLPGLAPNGAVDFPQSRRRATPG